MKFHRVWVQSGRLGNIRTIKQLGKIGECLTQYDQQNNTQVYIVIKKVHGSNRFYTITVSKVKRKDFGILYRVSFESNCSVRYYKKVEE